MPENVLEITHTAEPVMFRLGEPLPCGDFTVHEIDALLTHAPPGTELLFSDGLTFRPCYKTDNGLWFDKRFDANLNRTQEVYIFHLYSTVTITIPEN